MRDFFELDQKALLRHMILHATEVEYKNFAIEMTIVSWGYFGWANKLEAYKNILDITTEAMQLALVFTDTFPKDRFITLLRALVQYCNIFSHLKYRRKNQKAEDCDIAYLLSKTLFSLKKIVNETQYGKIYDNLFECIDDMYGNSNIKDYFDDICELIDICFLRSEEIER